MFSCLQQAEHNFFTSYSQNRGPVDKPIPVDVRYARFFRRRVVRSVPAFLWADERNMS